MKFFNFPLHTALIIVLLAVAGCETRSISDSGYRSEGNYGRPHSRYGGELSEFDVLGIERGGTVSDAQISKALDSAARVKIKKGGLVMLIQSGAGYPDEPMQAALSQNLNVVPFNGVPESSDHGESYARTLRLAAARGGCETIVCYWGILESAREEKASKRLSWIPVVGWAIPDERQHMRIRLKIALIDVRSGNWSIFSPEPFDDSALSALYTREKSDQRQVNLLKQKAYETAAKDLVKIYGS